MKKHVQYLSIPVVITVVMVVLLAGIGGSDYQNTASLASDLPNDPPGLSAPPSALAPIFYLAAVSPETCEEQGKVLICHVPPGNPENAQTLCVDPNGWDGHANHPDDYLGPCIIAEPTATPTPTIIEPTPTPTIAEPTPTPTPTSEGPPPTPTPTTTAGLRWVKVIAPPDQTGELGETIYYEFEIINKGDIADTFRLILTSEHDLPTGEIQETIFLEPHQEEDIATYIELPLTLDTKENWSDDLMLKAVSVTDEHVNDEDTVTTFVLAPNPTLVLKKDVDKSRVAPGERLTYTLRYKNTGNTPLLNAVITDQLPEQLVFESSSINMKISGENLLEVTLPPVLYQDQEGRFTLTARVREDAEAGDAIVNTAVFEAENLDDPVIARARSTIEAPELQIEKAVNKATATVGDILLYTITVSNNGSGTARNAQIFDTLPEVMRYLTGTTVVNGAISSDPQMRGGQDLVWTVGDLAAGDQVVLRYQVTVIERTKSGVYRNKAIVEAQDRGGRTIKAGPAKTKVRIATTGGTIPADIEGVVFLDANQNDFQDADEPGVQGVQVILIRGGIRQTTDEDGLFVFADVAPDEQAVGLDETTLPAGYHLTTESTVLLSLAEGSTGYVEFGVQSDLCTIVGLVYHDLNQNNQRDPGEPGISGVQVIVDGKVFFVTDADGMSVASHFPAGPRTVALNLNSLPAQYQLASDRSVNIVLQPGETKQVEFAVGLRPGTIRGTVFWDVNANGALDPGEAGIADAALQLQDGISMATLSDALGNYTFGQVEPGVYTLSLQPESLPLNARPTGEPAQSVIVEAGQEYVMLWGVIPIEELTPTPSPTPTSTPTSTATPMATPTPEEEYCVYQVKAGDTLSSIAVQLTGKYQNYQRILEVNDLSFAQVSIGDELKIPQALLLEIYQTCDFDQPTPTPTPMPEEFCLYTVKAGESLSVIAGRVTGDIGNYQQIMALNALTSEAIYPGDQFKIPKSMLLEKYQDCQFDRPIVDWTRLVGRVFFDRNQNQQYDEDDLLVENFYAILDQRLKTRGKDGIFVFSHIEAGEHTIDIQYGNKTKRTTVTLEYGNNQRDFPLRYTGIRVIVTEHK